MAYHPWTIAVLAFALAVGAISATNAQAAQPYHRRPLVAHRHLANRGGDHLVSRGGDVVVHTGRSYLDPGPSAAEGTEDRYFYDTAHTDFRSEGPDFTRNTGGFELLPTPYSLPGRQETFGDFN